MKIHLLRWIKKHKTLVIILGLILFILLALFGTQIWLFVRFMLGNDTVVQLKANKEVLSLVHGQEEEVQFEASITTNLFCTAACTSEFIDIGRKKTIEREVFNVRTGNDQD